MSCPCPYSETVVRIKQGKEKTCTIHYGYVPLRLPEHQDKPLWMLVVKRFGRKPLMILTTEPLRRSQKVLRPILSAYIKRWSVEGTIRFVKQTYDLENIRVLCLFEEYDGAGSDGILFPGGNTGYEPEIETIGRSCSGLR